MDLGKPLSDHGVFFLGGWPTFLHRRRRGNHHAVFAPTITEVVKQEMGPQEWTALRDAACSELGIEIKKDVIKNAEVLRRMLRRATRDGLSSSSLEAASRAIVVAVERDLIDPPSPMVK